MRKKLHIAIAALAVMPMAGCDDLVDVINPDVVEASSIDPSTDQATFALSALQDWYDVYTSVIVYQAWFTNEARVGDTFPTRNEFGRRIVSDANGTMSGAVFNPLALAVATTADAADLLSGLEDASTNLNLLRVNFAAGWARLAMAETFCQSVIRLSAPMTSEQMLDSAIVAFERAVSIGTANGSSTATDLANASRVGLARALLQKGSTAEAASVANAVPASFVFAIDYADIAGNRGRLGNDVFSFSAGGGRESLVVGPEWRAIADAGDERISYVDAGRLAQDGELQMFSQTKYTGYDADVAIASGLQARYIAAEANGTAAQLALLNERRVANGDVPFTGTSASAVLTEFLRQKGIDLWLQGTRMGDFRRHGNAVPFIIPPGNNYYKPQLGEVSDQTCIPVPDDEKDNNPNWTS